MDSPAHWVRAGMRSKDGGGDAGDGAAGLPNSPSAVTGPLKLISNNKRARPEQQQQRDGDTCRPPKGSTGQEQAPPPPQQPRGQDDSRPHLGLRGSVASRGHDPRVCPRPWDTATTATRAALGGGGMSAASVSVGSCQQLERRTGQQRPLLLPLARGQEDAMAAASHQAGSEGVGEEEDVECRDDAVSRHHVAHTQQLQRPSVPGIMKGQRASASGVGFRHQGGQQRGAAAAAADSQPLLLPDDRWHHYAARRLPDPPASEPEQPAGQADRLGSRAEKAEEGGHVPEHGSRGHGGGESVAPSVLLEVTHVAPTPAALAQLGPATPALDLGIQGDGAWDDGPLMSPGEGKRGGEAESGGEARSGGGASPGGEAGAWDDAEAGAEAGGVGGWDDLAPLSSRDFKEE